MFFVRFHPVINSGIKAEREEKNIRSENIVIIISKRK